MDVGHALKSELEMICRVEGCPERKIFGQSTANLVGNPDQQKEAISKVLHDRAFNEGWRLIAFQRPRGAHLCDMIVCSDHAREILGRFVQRKDDDDAD